MDKQPQASHASRTSPLSPIHSQPIIQNRFLRRIVWASIRVCMSAVGSAQTILRSRNPDEYMAVLWVRKLWATAALLLATAPLLIFSGLLLLYSVAVNVLTLGAWIIRKTTGFKATNLLSSNLKDFKKINSLFTQVVVKSVLDGLWFLINLSRKNLVASSVFLKDVYLQVKSGHKPNFQKAWEQASPAAAESTPEPTHSAASTEISFDVIVGALNIVNSLPHQDFFRILCPAPLGRTERFLNWILRRPGREYDPSYRGIYPILDSLLNPQNHENALTVLVQNISSVIAILKKLQNAPVLKTILDQQNSTYIIKMLQALMPTNELKVQIPAAYQAFLENARTASSADLIGLQNEFFSSLIQSLEAIDDNNSLYNTLERFVRSPDAVTNAEKIELALHVAPIAADMPLLALVGRITEQDIGILLTGFLGMETGALEHLRDLDQPLREVLTHFLSDLKKIDDLEEFLSDPNSMSVRSQLEIFGSLLEALDRATAGNEQGATLKNFLYILYSKEQAKLRKAKAELEALRLAEHPNRAAIAAKTKEANNDPNQFLFRLVGPFVPKAAESIAKVFCENFVQSVIAPKADSKEPSTALWALGRREIFATARVAIDMLLSSEYDDHLFAVEHDMSAPSLRTGIAVGKFVSQVMLKRTTSTSSEMSNDATETESLSSQSSFLPPPSLSRDSSYSSTQSDYSHTQALHIFTNIVLYNDSRALRIWGSDNFSEAKNRLLELLEAESLLAGIAQKLEELTALNHDPDRLYAQRDQQFKIQFLNAHPKIAADIQQKEKLGISGFRERKFQELFSLNPDLLAKHAAYCRASFRRQWLELQESTIAPSEDITVQSMERELRILSDATLRRRPMRNLTTSMISGFEPSFENAIDVATPFSGTSLPPSTYAVEEIPESSTIPLPYPSETLTILDHALQATEVVVRSIGDMPMAANVIMAISPEVFENQLGLRFDDPEAARDPNDSEAPRDPPENVAWKKSIAKLYRALHTKLLGADTKKMSSASFVQVQQAFAHFTSEALRLSLKPLDEQDQQSSRMYHILLNWSRGVSIEPNDFGSLRDYLGQVLILFADLPLSQLALGIDHPILEAVFELIEPYIEPYLWENPEIKRLVKQGLLTALTEIQASSQEQRDDVFYKFIYVLGSIVDNLESLSSSKVVDTPVTSSALLMVASGIQAVRDSHVVVESLQELTPELLQSVLSSNPKEEIPLSALDEQEQVEPVSSAGFSLRLATAFSKLFIPEPSSRIEAPIPMRQPLSAQEAARNKERQENAMAIYTLLYSKLIQPNTTTAESTQASTQGLLYTQGLLCDFLVGVCATSAEEQVVFSMSDKQNIFLSNLSAVRYWTEMSAHMHKPSNFRMDEMDEAAKKYFLEISGHIRNLLDALPINLLANGLLLELKPLLMSAIRPAKPQNPTEEQDDPFEKFDRVMTKILEILNQGYAKDPAAFEVNRKEILRISMNILDLTVQKIPDLRDAVLKDPTVHLTSAVFEYLESLVKEMLQAPWSSFGEAISEELLDNLLSLIQTYLPEDLFALIQGHLPEIIHKLQEHPELLDEMRRTNTIGMLLKSLGSHPVQSVLEQYHSDSVRAKQIELYQKQVRFLQKIIDATSVIERSLAIIAYGAWKESEEYATWQKSPSLLIKSQFVTEAIRSIQLIDNLIIERMQQVKENISGIADQNPTYFNQPLDLFLKHEDPEIQAEITALNQSYHNHLQHLAGESSLADLHSYLDWKFTVLDPWLQRHPAILPEKDAFEIIRPLVNFCGSDFTFQIRMLKSIDVFSRKFVDDACGTYTRLGAAKYGEELRGEQYHELEHRDILQKQARLLSNLFSAQGEWEEGSVPLNPIALEAYRLWAQTAEHQKYLEWADPETTASRRIQEQLLAEKTPTFLVCSQADFQTIRLECQHILPADLAVDIPQILSAAIDPKYLPAVGVLLQALDPFVEPDLSEANLLRVLQELPPTATAKEITARRLANGRKGFMVFLTGIISGRPPMEMYEAMKRVSEGSYGERSTQDKDGAGFPLFLEGILEQLKVTSAFELSSLGIDFRAFSEPRDSDNDETSDDEFLDTYADKEQMDKAIAAINAMDVEDIREKAELSQIRGQIHTQLEELKHKHPLFRKSIEKELASHNLIAALPYLSRTTLEKVQAHLEHYKAITEIPEFLGRVLRPLLVPHFYGSLDSPAELVRLAQIFKSIHSAEGECAVVIKNMLQTELGGDYDEKVSFDLNLSRWFLREKNILAQQNDAQHADMTARIHGRFAQNTRLQRFMQHATPDLSFSPIQPQIDHILTQEVMNFQEVPKLLAQLDKHIVSLIQSTYLEQLKLPVLPVPNALGFVQFVLEQFYSYSNPGQDATFIHGLLDFAFRKLSAERIHAIADSIGQGNFPGIIINTFSLDTPAQTPPRFDDSLIHDFLGKDPHRAAEFVAKNILVPFGAPMPLGKLNEYERMFTKELEETIRDPNKLAQLCKGLFNILYAVGSLTDPDEHIANSAYIALESGLNDLLEAAHPLLNRTPPSQMLQHLLLENENVKKLLYSEHFALRPILSTVLGPFIQSVATDGTEQPGMVCNTIWTIKTAIAARNTAKRLHKEYVIPGTESILTNCVNPARAYAEPALSAIWDYGASSLTTLKESYVMPALQATWSRFTGQASKPNETCSLIFSDSDPQSEDSDSDDDYHDIIQLSPVEESETFDGPEQTNRKSLMRESAIVPESGRQSPTARC